MIQAMRDWWRWVKPVERDTPALADFSVLYKLRVHDRNRGVTWMHGRLS